MGRSSRSPSRDRRSHSRERETSAERKERKKKEKAAQKEQDKENERLLAIEADKKRLATQIAAEKAKRDALQAVDKWISKFMLYLHVTIIKQKFKFNSMGCMRLEL